MKVDDIPGELNRSLDSLLLGWAHWRTRLLARRVVLAIHDDGLRGAVLGGKGDAVEVPLPPGTCRQGQPQEIEAIGDLIGDLFLDLGLAGAKLSACLPLQSSCWRVVRWPQGLMPESGSTELRLRAPDLGIPWSLSEVYLAVEPLPGTPARSLVVASPRKVVDGWMEVFELAGLQLQRLLPAQVCEWQMLLATAAQDAKAGEQWLLELRPSRCRLWLVVDGRPIADWSLPGQPRNAGLDPTLTEELQRCCRFWLQHNGAGVAQSWWVYGSNDLVDPVEAELKQLLPAGALQRWQPPVIGANLDLRLGGLKLCMG